MNELVFPQEIRMPEHGPEAVAYFVGLSKRELFAAMAMQGICAWGDTVECYSFDRIPGHAVKLADALIAELAKEKS